jgi:hypothetical protein
MTPRFIPTKNPLKDRYISFIDKEKSINSLKTRIKSEDDVADLFSWLLKAKEHEFIIFRGMSESYYKHYSHSQRQFSPFIHWPDSYELFYELLIDSVEYAKKWNGGTIQNYLLKRGIKDDFFAYLSMMQHFGIPTPLMDFTRNPYVALYFSTAKNCELNNNNNFEDINEYCSLYFINKQYKFLKSLRRHFERTIQINQYNGYSKEKSFFYGLRFTPHLIINEDDELLKISNNANIINQEGLFILNGSPNQPLEDQHNMTVEMQMENLSNQNKNIDLNKEKRMFGCWEIHKSMNAIIRTRLNNEFGINEQFLFPNMSNLKRDFENEFKYPTNADVCPGGSYWANCERAIKYIKHKS